jgi:hypothetical protein
MIRRAVVVALVCAAVLACDRRAARQPSNHGLMGFIDSPTAGSTVGPVFLVAGWAVGREGVERVRVYLDDELMATIPVTIPRPDIDREHPRYASTGPNHGFGATIDAGSRAGFRTIRIEAVDKRGAAAHVAAANVKIEP